jgi:hypothetical protein
LLDGPGVQPRVGIEQFLESGGTGCRTRKHNFLYGRIVDFDT